ncbi:uncharacterized protein DFL_000627 [Arthrobotrys flagrans]|uniref:Uncharacterized protein n=1 Tax=Arthrobotrys flagrans TaxID=97331 RepID=A0A437AES4_ARTFL|nr:hypothetical protein DFL_000627 [Arthrobotrys flagrans]
MSATHAQQGPPSGPSRLQQPPYIPKPKTLKHSITNKILQEAFEVDYFLSRTNNWQDIKISAVVKVFKSCCEGSLLEHSPEFEAAVKGFNHQSENVKNQIYNKFVNNIRFINVSQRFREILFDMLESANEDRWLFVWIAGQTMKGWQRPPDWCIDPAPHPLDQPHSSTSSAQFINDQNAEPPERPRAERRDAVGINERK